MSTNSIASDQAGFTLEDANTLADYLNNFDWNNSASKMQRGNFNNQEMDEIFPLLDRFKAYANSKNIALDGGYGLSKDDIFGKYAYLYHHHKQAHQIIYSLKEDIRNQQKAELYSRKIQDYTGVDFRNLVEFIIEDLHLKGK